MQWDAKHPLILDRPKTALVGTGPASIEALSSLSGRDWIGYLSYDLVRCFEHLPALADDRLRTPLYIFGQAKRGIGVSPVHSALQRRAHGRDAHARIVNSTFTRDEYLATVRRVIDYISAGDVYQVNLAQIFTASQHCASHEIFDCDDRPEAIHPTLNAAFPP